MRERHYDLVVVDAEASGHIVGQITAPRAINDLVQVGMVRDQTEWMLEILEDPATTGVVVVTTPEEMPVTETIELVARLRAETTVAVAAVVANRVLPEPFGHGEEAVFERDRGPRSRRCSSVSVGKAVDAGARCRPARGAAPADGRRAPRRAPGRLPTVCRCCTSPSCSPASGGRRAVELVATALGEEL